MQLSVRENLSLPALSSNLAGLSLGPVVRGRLERSTANARIDDLSEKDVVRHRLVRDIIDAYQKDAKPDENAKI